MSTVSLISNEKGPIFSLGALAPIRDEEWRIRLVDLSTDGGWWLACGGTSDLVRGQIVLEDDIGIVGSVETLLVPYDPPITTPACCIWEASVGVPEAAGRCVCIKPRLKTLI